MSKKLPKYKKDALSYLLNWANSTYNTTGNAKMGYTKLVYSEEHASVTFYPYNTNLPEVEVGLDYNVKGRVQLGTRMSGKVTAGERISDDQASTLATCVSQILQKVPLPYKGEYGKERPIGFHYSTHNGVLSVRGSYNNQYMYPGS